MKCGFIDSSWPVLLVVACVGSFTIALTPSGRRLIAAAQAGFGDLSSNPPGPARPLILVATTDPDDAHLVAATAVPRLYQVLCAGSLGAAERMLRSNAGRIGVILVDGKSAEGRSLAKLAQAVAPEAKLIRVPAKHGPTEIVSEVLAVI